MKSSDRKALFNTNMVLFNLEVLGPLLDREIQNKGISHLEAVMRPDLITNPKAQIDKDGETREYKQLEGALGSVVLNLDRYYREQHNIPLISFLNIERESRTQFFAPIKTAFDYYMQFYSDRFQLDPSTFTLKDMNPGKLPSVKLEDPASKNKLYNRVDAVLAAFKGTKIRYLENLHIIGPVVIGKVELRGNIKLVNRSNKVITLEEYLKRYGVQEPYVLENTTLFLD